MKKNVQIMGLLIAGLWSLTTTTAVVQAVVGHTVVGEGFAYPGLQASDFVNYAVNYPIEIYSSQPDWVSSYLNYLLAIKSMLNGVTALGRDYFVIDSENQRQNLLKQLEAQITKCKDL